MSSRLALNKGGLMELTFDDVCLLSNLLSELFSPDSLYLFLKNPTTRISRYINLEENEVSLLELQARFVAFENLPLI